MRSCLLIALLLPDLSWAQSTVYVGGVVGVSTLSADARSIIGSGEASISLYKPENGPAANAFAGTHLNDFLSLQLNYVWNRNRIATTSVTAGSVLKLDEQRHDSTQHSVIVDVLLYFRNRTSWARPYLSTGVGVVDYRSRALSGAAQKFSSQRPGLRVAVGIDLQLHRSWGLRYTFSETLRQNPISERLSPPGGRNLANFQNLAGIVTWF